jgi:hypothetical protein
MSEISLAVGDGSRRMTYAELADARGISLASARRLARRHYWHREAGNDGIVRVTVPLGVCGQPLAQFRPHRRVEEHEGQFFGQTYQRGRADTASSHPA